MSSNYRVKIVDEPSGKRYCPQYLGWFGWKHIPYRPIGLEGKFFHCEVPECIPVYDLDVAIACVEAYKKHKARATEYVHVE